MPSLVSIGIPVFNTGKYICDTLDSIKNQTYKNIEIIVVDDGSSDDSYQQVLSWSERNSTQINLIRNGRNMGLSYSCNVILNNAKGEFLQKVDADDVLMPDKIERHVAIMERLGEGYGILYSDVSLIDGSGGLIDQSYFDRIEYDGKKTDDSYSDLLKMNFIPNPSVLMRTATIRQVGGFDDKLLFEDWDMWLRLALKYKIYYDNCVSCYYRIHSESMMSDEAKAIMRNNTKIEIYKKNLRTANKKYREEILNQLRKLSIFSYFKNDPDAKKKLGWFLKNRFDPKVVCYFLMASMHIKHPSNYANTGSNKNYCIG